MFERFSKPARRVVRDAVAEAERRDDSRIGTEHLVIALASAELSVDRAVLGPLDVTPHQARQVLAELEAEALASVGVDVAAGPAGPAAPWPVRRRHRPFTHGARDVLEAALEETLRLGMRRITPEAILLGLLRAPHPDTAGRMMDRLGVDRAAARAALVAALRRIA